MYQFAERTMLGNGRIGRYFNVYQRLNVAWFCSMEAGTDIDRVVRIINDHPFPHQPLRPTLQRLISPAELSTPFVENVLGSLFGAHSNGLKAYEFFKYCLDSKLYVPSSGAFDKTLHILARMRYFQRAWELLESMKLNHPSLLTLKTMGIMLSRIAKCQSYEETLEAFERMERDIFQGKKFGTNEFNVLLRAFCTQRLMKEARSVFHKMHPLFPPNTKTMNILLLGFKESGDITAVELFHHEMIRRGFKPNNVTYNIRIDVYCKKGCFGDALRLLDEMERAGLSPSVETITTLIHGAGVARNIPKAKHLFEEISRRSLQPDTGAYNALLSSLIRSKDVHGAAALMEEMEKANIQHDNVTYHNMFLGLMKSDGIDGVSALYTKMVGKNFVPKTRTVIMLMKCFCQNSRVDSGLELWNYMVEKGHCPHSHALDLLVTGLCARGRVEEALACCKQMLERGRLLSDRVFQMMGRFLAEKGEPEKFEELEHMTNKLKLLLPSTPARSKTVRI